MTATPESRISRLATSIGRPPPLCRTGRRGPEPGDEWVNRPVRRSASASRAARAFDVGEEVSLVAAGTEPTITTVAADQPRPIGAVTSAAGPDLTSGVVSGVSAGVAGDVGLTPGVNGSVAGGTAVSGAVLTAAGTGAGEVADVSAAASVSPQAPASDADVDEVVEGWTVPATEPGDEPEDTAFAADVRAILEHAQSTARGARIPLPDVPTAPATPVPPAVQYGVGAESAMTCSTR